MERGVSTKISVLLIDDQEIVGEAIRRMLGSQEDISFHFCKDPSEAISMALHTQPTVILQDLVMPGIDGLDLVKYFRALEDTRDIPLIVLSSKEDPLIKAKAFELGANDYLVKLPDSIELIARIRYHSKGYTNLLERNSAYIQLEENQKILLAELAEAAAYVRSQLPKRLEGQVATNWAFQTSTQLGGDAFGYHWIGDDHLAFYLLDVCGHGVGAALLSVSAMNVLSAQSLPNTNFPKPAEVLASLNRTFPMEEHNNMFFTICYAIYQKSSHTLTYSSGGHPPSVLLSGPDSRNLKATQLHTKGMPIGAMEDMEYAEQSVTLDKVNQLFLFSDGMWEIKQADGSMLKLQQFIAMLEEYSIGKNTDIVDKVMERVIQINGSRDFADDTSFLQATIMPNQ